MTTGNRKIEGTEQFRQLGYYQPRNRQIGSFVWPDIFINLGP